MIDTTFVFSDLFFTCFEDEPTAVVGVQHSVVDIFAEGSITYRKKKHNRVSFYTFLAVSSMYILAMTLWIIDVHNVLTEVRLTLLPKSDDPLGARYSSAQSSIVRLAAVEDVLYNYMVHPSYLAFRRHLIYLQTIIGDCIIIWRVFAFWPSQRERFVLGIPLLFLTGSLCMSILFSATSNVC